MSYFIDLHVRVTVCNTYNYCGARIPLEHNGLKLDIWKYKLSQYHDQNLLDFLEYGWPLGLDSSSDFESAIKNHPSSVQFAEPVDKFIIKQISASAIAGPSIICTLNLIFV